MDLKHLKSCISCISGLIILILFILFTFTAVMLFPGAYTPINNWLSDLGNSGYSPVGSIFFNAGCIITGLMLFPFFIGLRKWYTAGKMQENSLKIGQSIGLFSAFSLIMIGVFSENYGVIHWIWSATFFISLFLVLIITNVSLFFNQIYKKWIFAYGIGAATIDLCLIMLYIVPNRIPKPLFEWLAVFTSLGWLGLIVYNMLKFKY